MGGKWGPAAEAMDAHTNMTKRRAPVPQKEKEKAKVVTTPEVGEDSLLLAPLLTLLRKKRSHVIVS